MYYPIILKIILIGTYNSGIILKCFPLPIILKIIPA